MKQVKLLIAVFIAVFVLALSEQPAVAYEYCEDDPTYQRLADRQGDTMDRFVEQYEAVEDAFDKLESVERSVDRASAKVFAAGLAMASCLAGPGACAGAGMALEAALLNLTHAQADYEAEVEEVNEELDKLDRYEVSMKRALEAFNEWTADNC